MQRVVLRGETGEGAVRRLDVPTVLRKGQILLLLNVRVSGTKESGPRQTETSHDSALQSKLLGARVWQTRHRWLRIRSLEWECEFVARDLPTRIPNTSFAFEESTPRVF